MSLLRLFLLNLVGYFFSQAFVNAISTQIEQKFQIDCVYLFLFLQVSAFVIYFLVVYNKVLLFKVLKLKHFFKLLLWLFILIFSVKLLSLGLEELVGNIQDTDAVKLLKNASGFNLFCMVFLAVVLVPIVEEVLFRGFLLQGLLDRGFSFLAYFISSFAFAIVHFHFVLLPVYIFIGWLLAYVYVKEKNLWMAILLHAFFNAISVIGIIYFQDVL